MPDILLDEKKILGCLSVIYIMQTRILCGKDNHKQDMQVHIFDNIGEKVNSFYTILIDTEVGQNH